MSQKADVFVHPEHPDDSAEIRSVVEAAFSSSPLGHHGEADLVECLRKSCPDVLSLVATHDDHVVGHVLFSRRLPLMPPTSCGKLASAGSIFLLTTVPVLVQNSLRSWPALRFGDSKWRDYDFSIELKKLAGNDVVVLIIGREGVNGSVFYGLGANNNTQHDT